MLFTFNVTAKHSNLFFLALLVLFPILWILNLHCSKGAQLGQGAR